MASEMVERVVEQLYGDNRWLGDRDEARQMVRSIIKAMREPTEAQSRHMNKALGDDAPPTRRWEWVWSEMIETALRDEP